ncbi:MAG TPA: A/G-specific adenine glycosylase [Roseiflexaceae bacterium]|nr:A/G-specific adenine glycosylase [Roseiflexaceae bacterium]
MLEIETPLRLEQPDDTNERTRAIQALLLTWFEQNARDLPWRRIRDPYRIMVSEIMLQQTQVDRVIPKYFAFLAAFPTLDALADASTADVIRAWAGLGYNRRAVNMQRAARAVRDEYSGQFPQTVEQLLALPGIGPYTAGAIACFAFEADVGFIDTNIRRVLRRLFFEPHEQPSERTLVELAQTLVPPGNGWQWNQAIMELGALVCTAANPLCWRCPLREQCRDYAWRRSADEQVVLAYGSEVPAPRRRIAERGQPAFAGSSRFFRGKIIDVLRTHPEGIAVMALGPLVKDDYAESDRDWLETLIAGLVRDGLAERRGDDIRLPA